MKLPKYIEVETSRYCNRSCAWCPNHLMHERRTHDFLSWASLERVAESLGREGYAGWFAFHNYNEPLANPRIVEEVKLVRKLAPLSQPTIFTNGDKLNAGIYADLMSAGLAQIRVTVYPRNRTRDMYSHGALLKWLERRPFLADKSWDKFMARQGPALLHKGSMEILLISPRIDGYYDRGGTIHWLSTHSRKSPCYMTEHSMSIDYLGNIKMCCNVVTGNKAHNIYMLGNIDNVDIVDAWNSPSFDALRELHAKADWSASPICVSCAQELRAANRED